MTTSQRIVSRIRPGDVVTVRVPGSKSVANRALVCAFLADGDSTIRGVPDGDDTAVIIDVLSSVRRISGAGDTWVVRGGSVTLPGIIDAKLAGTSSRFLTALAALQESTVVIDGAAPLRGRPMKELHDALVSLGAQVEPLGEVGCLPVSVTNHMMSGGSISVRGDVSSQFISALMLIAPMLRDGLTISIDGDLVSRSYVEMTAAVMREFGAVVDITDDTIVVNQGRYTATDYLVEPDFSSAAFPLVVPIFVPCTVRVPGLAKGNLQGDSEILTILSAVGCEVRTSGDDIEVARQPNNSLTPVSLTMTDCSDLVPAVAVALSSIEGQSRISGVGFIRKKESDRLADLAHEMRLSGADVENDDDGLTIRGHHPVSSCSVRTHHDHRLAMSLSLMCLLNGVVELDDVHVVSKSWPTYFQDMERILGPVEK